MNCSFSRLVRGFWESWWATRWTRARSATRANHTLGWIHKRADSSLKKWLVLPCSVVQDPLSSYGYFLSSIREMSKNWETIWNIWYTRWCGENCLVFFVCFFFSLEKRLLTGDLTAIFHHLSGAIEKVESDSSQRQTHSKAREHNHKLQQGKFRLCITRLCFTYRVVKHWKSLPRELVYPLFLEVFPISWDKALSNLI